MLGDTHILIVKCSQPGEGEGHGVRKAWHSKFPGVLGFQLKCVLFFSSGKKLMDHRYSMVGVLCWDLEFILGMLA